MGLVGVYRIRNGLRGESCDGDGLSKTSGRSGLRRRRLSCLRTEHVSQCSDLPRMWSSCAVCHTGETDTSTPDAAVPPVSKAIATFLYLRPNHPVETLHPLHEVTQFRNGGRGGPGFFGLVNGDQGSRRLGENVIQPNRGTVQGNTVLEQI